jgi:thiol-disulfide isomerase/thioredoxin
LERLKQVAVDDGQTVLVDFSAEWCINCKLFEKTVLHTQPVQQAIAKSRVVTMYADYTDYPDEIQRTLKALRANGVPVIAIFPGNFFDKAPDPRQDLDITPYQVIVMAGFPLDQLCNQRIFVLVTPVSEKPPEERLIVVGKVPGVIILFSKTDTEAVQGPLEGAQMYRLRIGYNPVEIENHRF